MRHIRVTPGDAAPIGVNHGGLPEYMINPSNVVIKRVSGVNPPF